MRFLLFVKHNLTFVWSMIETVNGLLFQLFFRDNLLKTAEKVCRKYSDTFWELRMLQEDDLKELADFFQKQPDESYLYFKPHGFGEAELSKISKNPAFMMFGVFERMSGNICGYFMMRFFANRKCFVGFLVDINARGRGIAGLMGKTMLEISWENNFTALATVSRKNEAAIKAYRKLNNFSVVKELPEDYICIKYEKEKN